jgi:hypothetical protein
MKFITLFLAAISVVGCQPAPSKVEVVFETPSYNSANEQNDSESSSIRSLDFQNFTFPWTKTFGYREKSFSLKNGTANLTDERKLSLNSLSYVDVTDDYDEQALVLIKIDDGNATYEMMYVYTLENAKPKLLESFEFGADNVYFGTAFAAHGELIIERYVQKSEDAECCPSIVEISYYKWQKNKFVQQGESQKVANGYVERLKKKNSRQ